MGPTTQAKHAARLPEKFKVIAVKEYLNCIRTFG